MAEGRIVGRAADLDVFGCVELVGEGIVTSTDGTVAVNVDEVGIGSGEVVMTKELFYVLCKA